MGRFLLVAAIVLAFVLAACAQQRVVEMQKQEVSFNTSDGWIIKGDYYPAQSEKGIILMPMMDHDRSSYGSIIPELQKNGFMVIALDMRGHGASTNKGTWRTMNDSDFKGMENDADEAKKFLVQKGAKEIDLMGASIGANIALVYAGKHSEVAKTALLSPGLNFRNVLTEKPASTFTKPLLVVATEGDDYSAQSARKIYGLAKGEKHIEIYPGSAHGTDMFSNNDSVKRIMDFLVK